MRPIGTRRGNPIVRRIIEQGQRRRLYYALSPDEAQVRGDESDPRALRWTREFFERLRSVLVPRMAVTESIEGGELRYFGAEGMQLWALHREHELVVAYDHGDTQSEIRERARRWIACLSTHTAPGPASRHWGHPVYGARVDAATQELDVVWATSGEWCRFALSEAPMARLWALPPHWPQQEMAGA
ncbi:MAG: hypothetical protein IT348_17950 [Candidatus Eisenbacteria bacterium]|nr:hypothetical protein [Candidatus Eisenbacteria bacterium]